MSAALGIAQASLALLSLARYFGALFAAYTFVILPLFEGHPHMGLLAAPQLACDVAHIDAIGTMAAY